MKNVKVVVATNLENGEVIFAKVARNNGELGTIIGLVSNMAKENESKLKKVSDNQYLIKDIDGEFINVQVVDSVIG